MILCSDVIIHIYEFVSNREMLSLALTCSDFRSIILFDEKNYEKSYFYSCKRT